MSGTRVCNLPPTVTLLDDDVAKYISCMRLVSSNRNGPRFTNGKYPKNGLMELWMAC
jgi:hypothetical protein